MHNSVLCAFQLFLGWSAVCLVLLGPFHLPGGHPSPVNHSGHDNPEDADEYDRDGMDHQTIYQAYAKLYFRNWNGKISTFSVEKHFSPSNIANI